MKYQQALQRVLAEDPVRMAALSAVQALDLPDGWIGAGFVRDAVWDHLHGYGHQPIAGDVDVVWFDREQCDPEYDRALEDQLRHRAPTFNWSVKNQARMHQHNGNPPYDSTGNALRYWPETATAVAVRLRDRAFIDTLAPWGLEDLFELRLRPTPQFEHEKLAVFSHRVASKKWLTRYPLLQLILPTPSLSRF